MSLIKICCGTVSNELSATVAVHIAIIDAVLIFAGPQAVKQNIHALQRYPIR
ncbi:MAG: hypothetical protein LAT67_02805 [Balneolales bacterium]|nr:hypothetical protein [Balneolales bacterium]